MPSSHPLRGAQPLRFPEMHAIVLTVPDEPALAALGERLTKGGVAHVTIREPDAPWDGALMSIGLVPARREELKRHLSSLPLLK
jgi:hypothetical protein